MDAKAYEDKLTGYIAGGFISMALSLGIDLGLIAALKNATEPLNIGELARICNLKERYTEEWLGCMVSAQIISLTVDGRYYVPESLKQSLKCITYAGVLPFMGQIYEHTKECFHADGPSGYSWNSNVISDRFRAWADDKHDADKVAKELVEEVRQLEGKLDNWLEIGCAQGSIARAVHKKIPQCKITATDYDQRVINRAIEKHEKMNLGQNLQYQIQNVEKLPKEWSNKFDVVLLFDVLHDLPNPYISALEVHRVLKIGGIAIFVDPGIHSNQKDNIGDVKAGIGLSASSFFCLPSSNASGGPGYGIGWGIERKREMLLNVHFDIQSECKILNSVFSYAIYCRKQNLL